MILYVQFEGILCDNSERLKLLPDFAEYERAFPGTDKFNQPMADWLMGQDHLSRVIIITHLPPVYMGEVLEAVHGLGLIDDRYAISFKSQEYTGKRHEVFAQQVLANHEMLNLFFNPITSMAITSGIKFADAVNQLKIKNLLATCGSPMGEISDESQD